MSGIQRSETEKNNRNRYIEAMGQKLTADSARKIDGQLATNLNKSLNTSLNTTMQDVDASVDRMLWAINRNQQIDANEQFAADEERRASRQQGVVDNYHNAHQNAYNQTVSVINEGVTAGNSTRSQLSPLSAAHAARYARGNAEVRAGMMAF